MNSMASPTPSAAKLTQKVPEAAPSEARLAAAPLGVRLTRSAS
jgi:hypothetical protein